MLAICFGAASASASTWPLCVPRTAPVQIVIRELGRSVRGRLVTYTLRSRQFLAIVGTLALIAVMPSGSEIVAGSTLMDGD